MFSVLLSFSQEPPVAAGHNMGVTGRAGYDEHISGNSTYRTLQRTCWVFDQISGYTSESLEMPSKCAHRIICHRDREGARRGRGGRQFRRRSEVLLDLVTLVPNLFSEGAGGRKLVVVQLRRS